MTANAKLGDRYRLLEHVGSGGMSTVWRGYDEVLRRRVAVKVLNAQYAADPDVRASLYREAQAVALLAHPHIATVFDYGEWTGESTEEWTDERTDESTAGSQRLVPFVVMEFVAGPTLSSVLAHEGTLTWPEGGVICAQVASALATAHATGIVHRDVKPGNVILGASGAKVVDFGISALVGENDYAADGQLLGTPAYVAPERLSQGRAGTAADVYALGMLLYRTLAGGLPWDVVTVTEILLAHRDVAPAMLPALSWIPTDARDLCEQCLAKDPLDRPTGAEMASRLADLVGIARPTIGLHHGRTAVEEYATMCFTTSDLTQPVPAASR